MTKVFVNRTEHIFIDIKLRPLIDSVRAKDTKTKHIHDIHKIQCTKSMKKVKIKMRAKSTLKEPSITNSRQHNRLLLLH